MQNINRVVLTANLTRDPELKETSGGTKVCRLRVACNSRVKKSGEWTDKANYFDVVCFGSTAENCNRYLNKGRPVAVEGRLDWQEWETDGNKRQAVQVIADMVQFLDPPDREPSAAPAQSAPAVSGTPDEEDIPF